MSSHLKLFSLCRPQTDTFQVISGVLALGNITFASTGDRKCAVQSKPAIEAAAHALKVSAKNLEHVVTNRAVRVPGSAPIMVPLSAEEAVAARDALAKVCVLFCVVCCGFLFFCCEYHRFAVCICVCCVVHL
jgi:myosin heavy subunit